MCLSWFFGWRRVSKVPKEIEREFQQQINKKIKNKKQDIPSFSLRSKDKEYVYKLEMPRIVFNKKKNKVILPRHLYYQKKK